MKLRRAQAIPVLARAQYLLNVEFCWAACVVPVVADLSPAVTAAGELAVTVASIGRANPAAAARVPTFWYPAPTWMPRA